jgi:hypothetical protein
MRNGLPRTKWLFEKDILQQQRLFGNANEAAT